MDAKDTKTTTEATKAAAGAKAAAAPTVETAPEGAIYIDARGKKKGKKRYSRNFKDVQRAARPLNRALERTAEGVASGFTLWRKDWDRSAEKKKDGAFKDAPENAGRALARMLRRSSWATADLGKVVRQTPLYRQLIRALLRP